MNMKYHNMELSTILSYSNGIISWDSTSWALSFENRVTLLSRLSFNITDEDMHALCGHAANSRNLIVCELV